MCRLCITCRSPSSPVSSTRLLSLSALADEAAHLEACKFGYPRCCFMKSFKGSNDIRWIIDLYGWSVRVRLPHLVVLYVLLYGTVSVSWSFDVLLCSSSFNSTRTGGGLVFSSESFFPRTSRRRDNLALRSLAMSIVLTLYQTYKWMFIVWCWCSLTSGCGRGWRGSRLCDESMLSLAPRILLNYINPMNKIMVSASLYTRFIME